MLLKYHLTIRKKEPQTAIVYEIDYTKKKKKNQKNIMESKQKEVEQSQNHSVMKEDCYVVQEARMLISSFLSFWSHMTLYLCWHFLCLSVHRADFTAFTWSFIAALKSAPSLDNLPCLVSIHNFYIPRGRNMVIPAYAMYTLKV